MTYAEELKEAHLARRARIAARAVPDTPIRILSASERSTTVYIAPPTMAPSPEINHEWVQRQLDIHKDYKPWFSIESESRLTRPIHPITLIQKICAKYYCVSLEHLLGERKTDDLVRVRQVACYFAKHLTDFSFPEIGRRFNRDHTTILHGMRKIERLLPTDPKLADDVAKLRSRIRKAMGC